MNNEIEEYASDFIKDALSYLKRKRNIRASFNVKRFVNMSRKDMLFVQAFVIGVIDKKQLSEKASKYGFKLSPLAEKYEDPRTKESGLMYTMYKDVFLVKEDIRLKGLKKLLI